MNSQQKLANKTIIGYSLGNIFGGGAFTIVGTLFLEFLTGSNVLISASIAGGMLLVGKIWDAFIDPFVGDLSEKIKSKYGKRRVFFLAGIFHITASFTLLWVPLGKAKLFVKIIYYTLAYMLFATSFSMTMVPYHAMLPELTSDINQRNKIAGIREIISNCSSLIAATIPTIIIAAADKFNQSLGYLTMGLVFGIFYAIPWIFVFKSTKKLDTPSNQISTEKIQLNGFKSFFKNGKIVLKNRSFRIMLGLYLLSYTAIDIFMAILIYFIKWYLNLRVPYFVLAGIFMVAQLLSIFAYIKLASKKGKRTSFIFATCLWSAGLVLMFLLASHTANVFSIYLCALVMGLGAGGVAYTPWAILPDVMDVEEVISGSRKDGIYSGFLTFIRQLSQGVAMLIVGIYLDAIDLNVASLTESAINILGNPTATELQNFIFSNMSEPVKFGIRCFSCFGPIVLLMAAMMVSTKLPINSLTYPIVQKELKNRGSLNENEQKTLEKITGIKYDNLPK